MRNTVLSEANVPDFTQFRGEDIVKFNNSVFQYQQILGSGDFGKVSLFESKNPFMQVALKEEIPLCGKYYYGSFFEREAKWYQLIYGLGVLSGDPKNNDVPHFVLMPYFPGKVLADIVFLSVKQLFIYWIKTAHAIHCLYTDNYAVHCDLKAANVIINEKTNNAHLIDFGLMCKHNEIRHAQFLISEHDQKEFWQHAPEIFTTQQIKIRAEHEQDVYSLGILLSSLYYNHLMKYNDTELLSSTTETTSIVVRNLTDQNPQLRWSISKAIYLLITTFFSQIPRQFWTVNNATIPQLQQSDMIQTIWKVATLTALQFRINALDNELKNSFFNKRMLRKRRKIMGLETLQKALQSDVMISTPALFSKKIVETKQQFPELTAGIFSKRTKTLVNEIASLTACYR